MTSVDAVAAAAASPPAGPEAGSRRLTAALVITVTVVAFQAMGVITVLPAASEALDGLKLYGWAMIAFMLASLGGTVLAGEAADRRWRTAGYGVAALTLAAGSAIAAAATSWTMLLGGRFLQGAGVGALMALAYAVVTEAYGPATRPRMIALMASAWLVPAFAGPALAGLVTDHASWRISFLMLLPLLGLACVLAFPVLRLVDRRETAVRALNRRRLVWAARLMAGVALLVWGAEQQGAVLVAAAVAVGLLLGFPALRALLPPGALLARGQGTGVGARGLFAAACIGTEAFVLLALTGPYGLSATAAGLTATGGALTWTAGAWIVARYDDGRSHRVRALAITAGGLLLAAGLALFVVALAADLHVSVMGAGWAVVGLGMGLGHPAATAVALADAAEGEAGTMSAALYIVDTVGVSLVSGLGGILVAAGAGRTDPEPLAVLFALGAGVAVLAGVVGARVSR